MLYEIVLVELGEIVPVSYFKMRRSAAWHWLEQFFILQVAVRGFTPFHLQPT